VPLPEPTYLQHSNLELSASFGPAALIKLLQNVNRVRASTALRPHA
jgi:hypothetical protein